MAVDPSFLGSALGYSSPTLPPFAATPTAYSQVPNLQVAINGVPVQNPLIGASITYGLDIGISSATVEFAVVPNIPSSGTITDPGALWGGLNPNYFDTVDIYAGATVGGLYYNQLRFSGLYLRTEATMWPNIYQLVCKGNLYRAAQYYPSSIFVGLPQFLFQGMPYGLPLIDQTFQDGTVISGYLNGQLGIDSHDGRIVWSILQQVPGLVFDTANILDSYMDTGAVTKNMIVLSSFDAVWPPYRSAWEQVQLFDQAFLGYRTYESLAGVINRSQIYGYPQPTPDFTFTEGVDIWEAQGTRTVEPLINASYVEGMTQAGGSDIGQVIYAFVQQSNPFQGSPVVEQFRSPFIETSDLLDPSHTSDALRADDVANWRLSERNRELVNVEFVTYQDYPLGAGRTLAVIIPHAAVTEPVWIQRVEIRVQAQPALFQQTIYGLGGGLQTGAPNNTNAGGGPFSI